MKCPLCGTRKAKRLCPAKSGQICAICCATKREIEIDCPIACVYLRESYNYAQEKEPSEPSVPRPPDERRFDRTFLVANESFLMELWRWIWDGFNASPQLHDADVLVVLAALEKTYQTLDKGLYYDSKPETAIQQVLFTRLKELIDAKVQNPDIHQHHLKISTVIDCLAFLQQFARLKNSGRPLSRGFLLQLDEIFKNLPEDKPTEEPRVVLE